jgi:hypothetical protein
MDAIVRGTSNLSNEIHDIQFDYLSWDLFVTPPNHTRSLLGLRTSYYVPLDPSCQEQRVPHGRILFGNPAPLLCRHGRLNSMSLFVVSLSSDINYNKDIGKCG